VARDKLLSQSVILRHAQALEPWGLLLGFFEAPAAQQAVEQRLSAVHGLVNDRSFQTSRHSLTRCVAGNNHVCRHCLHGAGKTCQLSMIMQLPA
jgi:hypothetical protein